MLKISTPLPYRKMSMIFISILYAVIFSPQDNWEKVPEIKIMVDGLVETIKSFTKLLKTINKATKIEGRLSFEAKQFTATKLR